MKHTLNNNNHILLSIGCNTNRELQMSLARERLSATFPGIRITDTIITAAYGKPKDSEPYANMLAECYTYFTESELIPILKKIETELGDNAILRSKGIVMMDLDLLEYNSEKRHTNDWERPYTKRLLSMLTCLTVLLLLFLPTKNTAYAQSADAHHQDTELLGKALEYYQGRKYHECMLTFERLKKTYKLTPRFMAYLGFSYYKEQQYENAAENLQQAIPHLSAYSPKEQAVYIYSCAESLFFLKQYKKSLKYYNMSLPLTEGNDKGDVLFHTAFAHYLLDSLSTDSVRNILSEAVTLYKNNTTTATALQRARLKQCKTMLKGLNRKAE